MGDLEARIRSVAPTEKSGQKDKRIAIYENKIKLME